MSFTDVFGGSTLQAAQVAYRAIALSADVTLVWPPYSQSSTDYVARIMDVTPSGAGFAITLPDATLVSPGQDMFWRNVGADAFTVKDSAGSTLITVSAGQVRYLYLQSNATTAGAWASILMGVGSSNLDASQLAGLGLKAIGNTLAFAPVTTTFNADYAVTSADRAKVFVWTGGAGTLTLPAVSGVEPDFEIEVRNQGTGALTISPVGGDQIDAGSDLVLQLTESGFVHAGPTAWYTVGRGRNAQFNFTALQKSVTGGTTTLSLTEAANVVQVYSGILASSEIVVVPAVVQVYYVINNTTGAHTFTVASPVGGGSTVSVDSGEAAILFCDGTNIINCTTSGAISINATIPAGSVGAPSLKFALDPTTGIYQPTSSTFAVTVAGVRRLLVTTTGINGTVIGATTPANGSFTNLVATTSAVLPANTTYDGYGIPRLLLATLSLYVNGTTGSDSTGTGAIGAPFKTISHTLGVAATCDTSLYMVRLVCADFDYSGESLFLAKSPIAQVDGYALQIIGNTATPANVKLGAITSYCPLALIDGCDLTAGIDVWAGETDINHWRAGGVLSTLASGALLTTDANGVFYGSHSAAVLAQDDSVMSINAGVVSGNPTYSTAFAVATKGAVIDFTGQPTGAAVGPRYLVSSNAVINTNGGGATWLPGNSAGSNPSGGEYV